MSVSAAGASPGVETVVTGVQGEVRYTLEVTLPRDQNAPPDDVGIRDVVVRDVLPDGMQLTNAPADGTISARRRRLVGHVCQWAVCVG